MEASPHFRPVALWTALFATLAFATGCSQPTAEPPDGASERAEGNGEQIAMLKTGRDVLKAVAAAYQAAQTYADRGTMRYLVKQDGLTIDETEPFAIALARPDRLRLEINQAKVVFEGGTLRAALDDLPGQVVVRDGPAPLSLDALDRSQVLTPVLGQSFARHLARLVLLLADGPIEQLLEGAQEPELAEPGEIEGRKCYRVRIRRDDQVAALWVDQESFVVRRIVLPPDSLIDSSAGRVHAASLVAELTGAQLNAPIPPEAFQFEIPPGAAVVKFFQPPHPADLLGKRVPEFQFVGLDGNRVGQESLAGEVTVLAFWATQCQPCRESLPRLDAVRRQYADNARVAFYAVNIDPAETPDSVLADLFDEMGVRIPIVRDHQQVAASAFHIPGVPTLFVIDAQGIVQHYELGASPRLTIELPATIETLLAGGNTYETQQQEYERQLQQIEDSLDRAESLDDASTAVPIPEAEIAPRSRPERFSLAPLWENTELKSPGNVLAFQGRDGRPVLAVVDAWRRIAALSLDGRVLAMHEPELESVELFNALRHAADDEGNSYFAAVALMSGQQRFHLLDEQFRLRWSFPSDALTSPHAGIADVQLGNLSGDGTLRAYVGYWGEVGVQEVSLDGQRIWGNRKVPNVQKMATTEPGPDGSRRLLCANVTGTLAVLDAHGRLAPPLAAPQHRIGWLAAADLTGDGRMEYCALAGNALGENEAVGLTVDGNSLRIAWTYRLPDGVNRQPVEPIIHGRLIAGGPAQWLLPGPDGSVHILSSDGELLDRFNYGAPLQGLGTVEIDGKPALVVCTEDGVAAWEWVNRPPGS